MNTTRQDGNRPPLDAPPCERGGGDKNDDTRLPDCNASARRRDDVAAKRPRMRSVANGDALRAGADAECRNYPNARSRASASNATRAGHRHARCPAIVPVVPIVMVGAMPPYGARDGVRGAIGRARTSRRARAPLPQADGERGASEIASFDPIFFFYHRLRSRGGWQHAGPTHMRRVKRDRVATQR
ncbi:hypothetical protein BTI_5634 [Burkholderia thailandensis MSMB121]|uniref:hypothetical protein n=1 Tax=Burkholderia humptydooensis TaxID=430531 RepID=UPI000327EDB4|nr:hypothetical protein [Burkholderia humptydooensis]AGK51052.1 hypothetical protein BTI_5634 [Burkholderia thailandensis MSMB121]ATF32962.1 hypothetical protein CO709_06035 [Burkholderia thailandensis]KST70864.1 hypothetical protein WS76_19775 [Burkholderia humptydooensis]